MERRDFLRGSVALAAGLALTPVNTRIAFAERNIIWGACCLPRLGEKTQQESVTALESKIGRTLDTTHYRLRWERPLVNDFTKWSWQTGHTPIISWFTRKVGGGMISWRSVAQGTHDAWITTQAKDLKATGWRGYFCFHKEPENEGGATDWKAAHDRVYQIFKNVGVPFSFVPTFTAYTFAGGNGGIGAWAPPRYELLGVDGYNRFGCSNTEWRSFEQIFAPSRTVAQQLGKQLYLIEWGCTEGSAGRKAAWFDEARARMKEWPEIVGCSYNHEITDCNYRVDSTTGSLQAFAAMGKDAMF
jgi:hypothetical protein